MTRTSIELLPGLRVGSSGSEFAGAIEQVFGSADAESASEMFHIEQHTLYRNQVPLYPIDGEDLAPLAESLLNHRCGLEPDWMALHAGHVNWGGHDYLISGERGSGKSTLVAELVARGGGYGSDELTALHLETGELRSIYKAITVKAAHSPLARDDRPCYQDSFRGPLQYVEPLGSPNNEITAPTILFPFYDPKAEAKLIQLSPGLTFLALGQQVFGGLTRDPRRAEHLLALVKTRLAFHLTYSDTEQALEMLRRIEAKDTIPIRCGIGETPTPSQKITSPGAGELRSAWNTSRAALGAKRTSPVPDSAAGWLDLIHAHQLDGLLSTNASPLKRMQPAAGRAAARRAISELTDLEQVLRDTDDRGILLKGASYLGAVYQVAAERTWSDIDFLFSSPDAAMTCYEHLTEMGYTAAGECSGHHHLPPLRHPVRPLTVELHTDLSQPLLGKEAMSWFAERTTKRFGWTVLNEEALWAATAIHALNDPVDSPFLRSLLEFAALDNPTYQGPDHPRIQQSIQLCRRMIGLLETDGSPRTTKERLLWRCLLRPADLRKTRAQRYRAVLDRATIERWHHRDHRWLPARSHPGNSTFWTGELQDCTVRVNLNSGELMLTGHNS